MHFQIDSINFNYTLKRNIKFKIFTTDCKHLESTDLESTYLVSTDLVSTDLVSTDFVSTDLVSTDF